MPIRVFLLDDHELVRPGSSSCSMPRTTSRSWASPDPPPRRGAGSPPLRPDVAVLDARLPDGSGIEVCRDVRSQRPDIKALMLTSFDDDEALFAAIVAGASGYVLKDIRSSDLVRGHPDGRRRRLAARPRHDRPGPEPAPLRSAGGPPAVRR